MWTCGARRLNIRVFRETEEISTACANPLCLVRVPANNSWIATGAVRDLF
jgi:hypothetical protein